MTSGSYIKRLFMVLILFVVSSSFALGAMLDPIINLIKNMGIAETLQAYPVVWDTILIATLLIMIFGRLLQDKFGYGVGAVLGVILTAAVIYYEVQAGFSIVDKIGPFAFAIVMIVFLIGLFSVLRHAIGNIAVAVTWAIGYPLIIGMFPMVMDEFRGFAFFAALEGVMFILWIVALISMFMSLWGFMRGNASLGGRGRVFGMGRDAIRSGTSRAFSGIKNVYSNHREASMEKKWKKVKSVLEGYYLPELREIIKRGKIDETKLEELNEEHKKDFLFRFARDMRNFAYGIHQVVKYLDDNKDSIGDVKVFEHEILKGLDVWIGDYIKIIVDATDKKLYPFVSKGDAEQEKVARQAVQEANIMRNSIDKLITFCSYIGVDKDYMEKLVELRQDEFLLEKKEISEVKFKSSH